MIIEVFKLSVILSVGIIGSIVIIGILIGWIERVSNRCIQLKFGSKAVIITGIIGTTIHEFSHYIVSKLFRHKVQEVKWFSLSSRDNSELGYVTHSYNPRSLYQRVGNFFIGVAPIVIGTLILIGFMALLLPDSFNKITGGINTLEYISKANEINIMSFIKPVLYNSIIILKTLFSLSNITSIQFWIYMFILISISTHMSLSKLDLKNSLDGIMFIFLISLVLSIILFILNFNILNIIYVILKLNYILVSFLSIGVLSSVISLVIIKLICLIK